jgi:hypothetical protein
MEIRNLVDLISTLSSEQQAAVEEFVKYLKAKSSTSATSPVTFQFALEAFVRDHPELLERLAQ